MNQDYIFASDHPLGILPDFYIVADGMGGYSGGELASRCTVETVVRHVLEADGESRQKVVQQGVIQANALLRRFALDHPRYTGMGTTFVACCVADGVLLTWNVGDSRLYVFRQGKLGQVSVDHSLVQEMVNAGTIDREDARLHPDRNVITRAVGAEDFLDVDFFRTELEKGDRILLCSDGLSSMLSDEEMEEILRQGGSPEAACRALLDAANEAGGKDNISVIVVDPDGTASGTRGSSPQEEEEDGEPIVYASER